MFGWEDTSLRIALALKIEAKFLEFLTYTDEL
jgi:hypothetical protein